MRRFLLLAGLTVGGLAWAANTQLGEILPYAECRTGVALLGLTSLAVGLLATGAALQSWRILKPGDGTVDVFLSRVGVPGRPAVRFRDRAAGRGVAGADRMRALAGPACFVALLATPAACA